ncbi:hypothetical protein L842_2791 [Mycobacterium intracellulare MIN_052511_1280]|nr:hypothetical protein L842_2791 [Mycobacterium intracellulare MIN_052511_1280]
MENSQQGVTFARNTDFINVVALNMRLSCEHGILLSRHQQT